MPVVRIQDLRPVLQEIRLRRMVQNAVLPPIFLRQNLDESVLEINLFGVFHFHLLLEISPLRRQIRL